MNKWINISDELPEPGSIVIAGHSAGWIERDVLFAEGGFRKRHNALTGGEAGYRQKDWKKPNGDPASPEDWPWGQTLRPTHWQLYPEPPQINHQR